MQKKITVENARMGMRVIELDINWINSPFWRREFTIKSDKEIQLLKEYCSTIVVDLKASSKTSLAHLLKNRKTELTSKSSSNDSESRVDAGNVDDNPSEKQKTNAKKIIRYREKNRISCCT
jgi:hypothetical protein